MGDVLGLVAEGASDKEIAQQLNISIHTVKSHMRNISDELHLGHCHEAALYALLGCRWEAIPEGG